MHVRRAAVTEAELVEAELGPGDRVVRLEIRRAAVGGERRRLVAGVLLDAGAGEERLERERVERPCPRGSVARRVEVAALERRVDVADAPLRQPGRDDRGAGRERDRGGRRRGER